MSQIYLFNINHGNSVLISKYYFIISKFNRKFLNLNTNKSNF